MPPFGPQFSWTERRNFNKTCFSWGLISAKWSGRASPVFFFRWHAKEELLILSQRQSESWLCQRQLYYPVVRSAEIWFLANTTNIKIPKENQKVQHTTRENCCDDCGDLTISLNICQSTVTNKSSIRYWLMMKRWYIILIILFCFGK